MSLFSNYFEVFLQINWMYFLIIFSILYSYFLLKIMFFKLFYSFLNRKVNSYFWGSNINDKSFCRKGTETRLKIPAFDILKRNKNIYVEY